MEAQTLAQARAEKKRAQIRTAAKALFLRSGFQGTSTDAIAATAGVSKETLYRYYPRKEDLFVDVVRSLTTERLNLSQWTERSTEPTSIQDLRMLLQAIARQVIETMVQPEYLAIFRLMLAELPRFPELGPLFRQTVPEPANNALLVLLRQGQAHGVVREHLDLPLIARMFFSTLLSYGILDGLLLNASTPQMPEARVINAFVEQIMELVSTKDKTEGEEFMSNREAYHLPPHEGFVLTHFLTVADVQRSAEFYQRVFDGTVVRDGEPTIIQIANSWLIVNVGGGPTDDKPEVTLHPPRDPNEVSSFLNIRVDDIWACYDKWHKKGAAFLTEPKDHGAEIRCYLRDPDGYLIEVGQLVMPLSG